MSREVDEHNAAVAELARLERRRAELSKQVEATLGPIQDAERANRERQVRADDAFNVCGLRAPEAIPGESEMTYRRRLIKSVQEHSPTWAKANIDQIPDGALDVAEFRFLTKPRFTGELPA